MIDPLYAMDYAIVVEDKKMKGSGLVRGDILMVSSTKVTPVKKSDPYLQRVYVLCIRVVGDEHQVPTQDNDYKVYLVDPRNLTKITDEDKLSQFKEALGKQYNHDKENETSN